MNSTLLSKLARKLITCPNLLWVRVLKHKYGDIILRLQVRNASQIWRIIESSLPVLTTGLEEVQQGVDNMDKQWRWKAFPSDRFGRIDLIQQAHINTAWIR